MFVVVKPRPDAPNGRSLFDLNGYNLGLERGIETKFGTHIQRAILGSREKNYIA